MSMQLAVAERRGTRIRAVLRSRPLAKASIFFAFGFLLLGCASSGERGTGEGPARQSGGEITVLDYLDTYLPRDSYIAKFEILSNGSAALLYPLGTSDKGRTPRGTHHLRGVPPPFVKAQRDLYSPRITGLLNRSPGAINRVTVLVVAADRPLNVEPFLDHPAALRDHLLEAGCSTELAALEEILNSVVPASRETIWEYDARLVSVHRSWAISG